MYAAGTPFPVGASSTQGYTHPSVQAMLVARELLPPNHPAVDEMMRNPRSHLLPPWHPALSDFVSKAFSQPSNSRVAVSAYHPDVDSAFRAGTAVDSSKHPSIQARLQATLPDYHPAVDELLANPSAHPLPAWHPRLGIFQSRQSEPTLRMQVSAFHPDANASYAAGTAVSAQHPSVQNFLRSVLPGTHPDVDLILRDPGSYPLPGWHPAVSQFQARQSEPELRVEVSAFHPDVDGAYAAGTGTAPKHPSVQALLQAVLPDTHPSIDPMLRDPASHPLPSWHPNIGRFQERSPPVTRTHNVTAFHPDPDAQYAAAVPIGEQHPSVQAMFGDLLPPTHPDVDTILRNPGLHPWPSWHPRIASFQHRGAMPARTRNVSAFHPDVDAQYAAGVAVSKHHPSIQTFFADLLPPTHPSVDVILSTPVAHPLPSWHPNLSSFQHRLPRVTRTHNVTAFHPDPDAQYAAAVPIGEQHPSVQAMFGDLLPPTHPDVDTILRNPGLHPWPSWHPRIASFQHRGAMPARTRNVSAFHPDADAQYALGVPVREQHPSIQTFFADLLPPTHPDLDLILRTPALHPFPSWHPKISSFQHRLAAPSITVEVTAYHPMIDAEYAAGNQISLTHPNVQNLLQAALPPTHPQVDEVLRNPAAHPLPSWHPRLSQFQTREAVVVSAVTVDTHHPNATTAYMAGQAVPAGHPLIHALLNQFLPENHPNCDDMIRDPTSHPLPYWHVGLDDLLNREEDNVEWTSTFSGASVSISVAYDHPDMSYEFASGTPIPEPHPSVQLLVASSLPEGHPNVDDILRDPSAHPLPSWHPALNSLVVNRTFWSPGNLLTVMVVVCFTLMFFMRRYEHLNRRMTRLRGARRTLSGGSNFSQLFEQHRDSMRDPSGTTQLNPSFVVKFDEPLLVLPTAPHPQAMLDIRSSPAGPVVSPVACGSYIFDVSVGDRVTVRGYGCQGTVKFTGRHHVTDKPRVGVELDFALGKNNGEVQGYAYFCCGEQRGVLCAPGKVKDSTSAIDAPDESNGLLAAHAVQPTTLGGGTNPRRRRRRRREKKLEALDEFDDSVDSLIARDTYAQELHSKHVARGGMRMYTHEEVVAPVVGSSSGIKSNSASKLLWQRTFQTRLPLQAWLTQWTTGNALFVLVWLALNVAALMLSGHSLDRGVGSLAAANTMFLMVPATRNNILTWTMGQPFDVVVLYHRFLGRFAIACTALHAVMYVDQIAAHLGEYENWTGFGAFVFGMVILLTSVNWVRRNTFNVFYWAHFAFLGFFLLAYLHSRQARPFLIGGIVLYGLDKALRFAWTWLPTRTLVFRNKGDIAQVRFAKNPLTRLAGRHKVGQYMFVNFPELSLTEWHPFSVTSGPKEDYIELHIRALGNHTRKIVAHSKKCAAENRSTLIRRDGPYGVHSFDYRRYGVVVLVGGGVGIAPIIGILKDIYADHDDSAADSEVPPHNVECVYVVWAMPKLKEADTFIDVLRDFARTSEERVDLPELRLALNVTQADEEHDLLKPPFAAGRPDFSAIFDIITSRHDDESTLVFGCGPGQMVNQLWDQSAKRNTNKRRVHFHHETFEF